MTQEIPDPVVAAIRHVVQWSRGSDGPGEISIDDILSDAVPVLDEWLVARGLLPAASYPHEEHNND